MAVAGLVNRKKNALVPLRSVCVESTVRGYTASVISTLDYVNEEEMPIEAVFTFPLDSSSTVVDFSATIQDRRIVGRVREKQEAQEMYDDAIAGGLSAFLMESERDDIFTVTVGNLPPKGKAVVCITFVMELPTEHDGSVRFNLPSVLTPRYSPASTVEETSNPTAGQVYLPSNHIPYSFSFNMRIHADVKKVDSSTHKLCVTQSTDEEGFNVTRVTLAEEHQFDKDVVLTISPSHPHQPHAVVEQGSNSDSDPPFLAGPAIALNYFPDFSSAEAISELIFVIDRSGSMNGAYIKAAIETLMLFLKSIPDGCHFNIVGFGSSYKFLFPTSVPYDQAYLDQACDHASAISADMGGTNLLCPLQEIFKMPSIQGLPKQVFVLTDGAVSNTMSVINEVKKNSHNSRCFAVGIGSGASTALVKGIASAGRGSSEFVQSGEKMQGKVMQMLKRALAPSLSDVHVSWSLPDKVKVIQTPAKVPPVFSGDRLVIYGFLSNEDMSLDYKCHATLQGVSSGNPVEYTVPFAINSPPAHDRDKTIHQLATKCIIHDLQEDLTQEPLQTLKGLMTKETEKPQLAKEKLIIELSVSGSVICQGTSFIAIDEESSEPVQGGMQLRKVPVARAHDNQLLFNISQPTGAWGGHSQGAPGALAAKLYMPAARISSSSVSFGAPGPPQFAFCLGSSLPPPPAPASVARSYAAPPKSTAYDASRSSFTAPQLGAIHGTFDSYKIKSKKAACVDTPTDNVAVPEKTFSTIVSQQRASGAWQMNSMVASLLNKSVVEIVTMSPIGKQLSDVQSSIWATCIVIAWLEARCSDLKDEWELLVDKAKSWVKKQSLPETLTFNDVLTAAMKLF